MPKKKSSEASTVEAAKILQDERFKELFTNPEFEVDETHPEFEVFHRGLISKKASTAATDNSAGEDIESELEGKASDAESTDSDGSTEAYKRKKSRVMKKKVESVTRSIPKLYESKSNMSWGEALKASMASSNVNQVAKQSFSKRVKLATTTNNDPRKKFLKSKRSVHGAKTMRFSLGDELKPNRGQSSVKRNDGERRSASNLR